MQAEDVGAGGPAGDVEGGGEGHVVHGPHLGHISAVNSQPVGT